MQRINFSIVIDAPREKVWEILWDIDSYQAWTKAFNEGSTVKTDNWKEGSKLLFLDANGMGMVSEVAANRLNEYMSFRHLGLVKNGIEDTSSDEVKSWAGSLENYTLTGIDGSSQLSVDMDISEEYKEMFEKIWPNALANIKALAEGTARITITISTDINAPVSKVWENWTKPEHITQWNQASDDWHCPKAENNVTPGGKLVATMAAKDDSFSFDFEATHHEVELNKIISSVLGDGRKMKVIFSEESGKTRVTESFEAENQNSLELQRYGWQAILNNFKKYTETL